MPTYTFRCLACRASFEVSRSSQDSSLAACDACGSSSTERVPWPSRFNIGVKSKTSAEPARGQVSTPSTTTAIHLVNANNTKLSGNTIAGCETGVLMDNSTAEGERNRFRNVGTAIHARGTSVAKFKGTRID